MGFVEQGKGKVKATPAISVIITVYNTEKFLAETLDSVIAQTFTDWEVICINDGSPDNSIKVLEKYVSRDLRIKVINQNNAGLSAARNAGIAAASGEYIFPLDSDDKIAPICLYELYKVITSTNYAVVSCEVRLFGEKNGPFNLLKPTRFNFYRRNCIVCSAMFRKFDWEKYGGYDENFKKGCEDYDFWLNFIDDGKKIVRIPKTLFFYRVKSKAESMRLQMSDYPEQTKNMLHEKHGKIIVYKNLRKIINIILMLPRFVFTIKTKKNYNNTGVTIKYIRILRIPVYKWRVAE